MSLTKYKLGNLVELFNEKCDNANLTNWDISGINSDKEFFEPSKQVGTDTSSYKNVPSNHFACNLMHVGRDKVLPIALNYTNKTKIVSPAYTVFKIKENSPLINEYFFMMLKSTERDRLFWFHTDSSVRDGMAWSDFCDIELSLPSINIQQKYVNIYKAMVVNQHSYEKGLDDFKFLCDIYVENLQKTLPLKKIKPYIHRIDIRNENNLIKNVMGISTKKEFREPTSKVNKNQLSNYKIVKPEQFCFVQTTHNEKVFAYAYNNTNKDIVISSVNEVFSVNKEILLPEYLCMFFNRTEFDRYARFHSWGSARETFTWDDLINVKIPIADINIQKSISKIYTVYKNRKSINDKLKLQIKKICPILIKGSIEEALK